MSMAMGMAALVDITACGLRSYGFAGFLLVGLNDTT